MRGIKSGSVVYEVLKPISFDPVVEFPRPLFVSEGNNIVVPKTGDTLRYEGQHYQVKNVSFGSGYQDDKRVWHVAFALLREIEDPKDLESRIVLIP